jgi:hypothetical protein
MVNPCCQDHPSSKTKQLPNRDSDCPCGATVMATCELCFTGRKGMPTRWRAICSVPRQRLWRELNQPPPWNRDRNKIVVPTLRVRTGGICTTRCPPARGMSTRTAHTYAGHSTRRRPRLWRAPCPIEPIVLPENHC